MDACVAVKWLAPEPFEDEAERLLTGGHELHAPAHWMAEVATSLWFKASIHRSMAQEEAVARLAWLPEAGVEETPLPALLPDAARLAFVLRITPYDAIYLALAERLRAPVVTADRHFHAAVQADAALAPLCLWIAEVP